MSGLCAHRGSSTVVAAVLVSMVVTNRVKLVIRTVVESMA